MLTDSNAFLMIWIAFHILFTDEYTKMRRSADRMDYLMPVHHIHYVTTRSNIAVHGGWAKGTHHLNIRKTDVLILHFLVFPRLFCSLKVQLKSSASPSTGAFNHQSLVKFCSLSLSHWRPGVVTYGSENTTVTPKSSLYRFHVFGLCGLSSSSLDRNSLWNVWRPAWMEQQWVREITALVQQRGTCCPRRRRCWTRSKMERFRTLLADPKGRGRRWDRNIRFLCIRFVV